jgi:hypothetical protein
MGLVVGVQSLGILANHLAERDFNILVSLVLAFRTVVFPFTWICSKRGPHEVETIHAPTFSA